MELTATTLLLFCASLALIAALYGSVGQAGASGFVAAMALFGFAPVIIKPTALVLNVLVSSVVAFRFARAGHFSWPVLWPFLLASVPAAYIGGYLTLPAGVFDLLLGVLLVVAAMPLLLRRPGPQIAPRPVPRLWAIAAGGCIGLVSGLTGMGGGVLLAPLLLYLHWASARTAAAMSAVFILINSAMALLGHVTVAERLPAHLIWFALAAVGGGYLGAHLGSKHFSAVMIRRLLGVTLLIAGLKLVLG